MADVTGSIGNEQVELNNAATEATLKAILASINKQTSAIVGMSKTGGGAGGGGQAQASQQVTQATNQQTKATKEETAATNEATAGMSKMAKGAMILGGVIGDLVGGVSKTIGNLTDFAGGLLDGKGGLSDFYGSLKDLPLGLGIVAGLFQKVAQMQEQELETYRTMSKAGVNFGGQLMEIRQNALELGLTLDQFGKIMAEHGKDFANMGATAEDGAKAFVKLTKELRGSEMGKELRALGYTADETAEKMANYITMTGGRTADQMKNTKELADASGRYMKELDQLSELTGESRDALEKKMQEESNDAAWQNYLQTLDTKGREKAMKALQESLATGGKGAGDALKNKLAGIPLTEAGGMFMSMAQRANAAQDEQVKAVKDGTKGLEDVRKATGAMAVGLKKDSEQIGRTTESALMQAGGAQGELTNAMLKNENNLNNKKINSAEDYAKTMADIEQKEKDRVASGAATAAESEKAFKDLGAELYGALMPILGQLTGIANDLGKQFIEFVKDHMPQIKSALKTLADFISRFAKDLFSEEGQKKIINDISYYMKLMLIEIKKAILPEFLYNDKDAERDKAKLQMEKDQIDAAAASKRNQNDAEALDKKIEEAKKANNDKALEKLVTEKARLQQQAKAEYELAQEKGKVVDAQKKADKKTDKAGDKGAAAGIMAGGITGMEIGAVGGPIGIALGAIIGGLIGGLTGNAVGTKLAKSNDPAAQAVEKKETDSKIPKAADGGFFEGPKEGFPVMLHGAEAVIPMDVLKSMTKSVLPDFMSKMPNMGDLGTKIDQMKQDPKAAMDSMTKSLGDGLKSVTSGAGNAASNLFGTPGPGGNEMLLKEIQTLNKQTADLVKYMKATLDENKTQTSKLGSLTGNLYV